MIIGAVQFKIYFPECHSLKEKRQILQKIKHKTIHQFPISIAEVSDHDIWQQATMGLALVGNDQQYVNSVMDKVINFIQNLYLGDVINKQAEYYYFNE